MATVTYDDRSLIVDGRRIWLVSGSIHYFRVPHQLWRDRLLKAKRAGLNCIETYVAWNFHEPREGQWDFQGDRDVVGFVRLAKELGLYVILRPGPYICAEWDFGGFPGWLATKTGIAYRTNNATYTHYFDKYFRQVLPRLAEHQVTRGGNIILIQNENEYKYTTMPDRLAYLEFINQLFRRAGFDVPIVNCNWFTDPPVPDNIECINGWGNEVQQLKRMSLRQPAAPLIFTEFWPGWFDHWGGHHHRKDAREVARRALEILGCGGEFNYYMFHGGTNFGFWGSRLNEGSAAYQTTSYDYDAPLAEGGGLTPKYYLTRLVNLLVNHMGRFLATCFMEEPPVTVHDSTCVLNLTGTAGRWAIVTSNGRSEIDSARLSLPNGRELQVSLAPIGATAIPVDVALSEKQTLDYSNLMPLGLFGENVLVFHGPEGWDGRISISGKEIRQQVPTGEDPAIIECEGLRIVVMSSDLAMRTWPVEDLLLIGPAYVGQTAEDVAVAPGSRQYCVLAPDGKLSHRKVKAPASRKPLAAPRLGSWKRVSVCREPADGELAWQRIAGPRDLDHLGLHHGYAWYRVEIPSEKAHHCHMYLPGCADRATIYMNGSLLGVWGRGPGATREPMPASLRRGTNVLTMLIDNMGRFNVGPNIGELKGLFDDIYDAKALPMKLKLTPQEGFSKRIVPRQFAHVLPNLESQAVWMAETSLPLSKVMPVHLSFQDVPHVVAVLCNDRCVGFFPRGCGGFGDMNLSSALKKGKNVLRMLLWGDVVPAVLRNFRLYTMVGSITEGAKWSFKPWDMPQEGGHVVGKDAPAWYISHFKYAPHDQPLFLHIVGAKKGQIFVNGHNVGRYWTIGPQQYYYLPECWLAEDNELLIFEEGGNIPARSRLEFRPLGPYQE